jgi:predicted Ser/Thr protein kinase
VAQASTARITLPERYRVVRHLANGGMASVWEAHDELLDRSVAVKVLASHLSEDDRARRRFEREGRAAAGLSSHPNVVTIYDVGEHDDRAFMVMELMRGGSLADRLRAGRPLPRDTVLDWLHDAAAALDVAHEAGIVHRDIKPANLLLDERDRLAIGDFGIARVAEQDQLTQTGQVLGTASYLSPEQALGEPAVAASDRYSLAVVAYELLTGTRPFQAEHFAAQARAHVEDEPEAPSARSPELPPAVDAVLARGLAKDPADRWPSATDMVARLERAVDEPQATAAAAATEPTRRLAPVVPVGSPPTPPAGHRPVGRPPAGRPPTGRRPSAPPPSPRGRPGGGALLAGLAGLALLAVLAFVLLSGGSDPKPTARSAATATPAKRKATPTPTAKATNTPTPTATATASPSATPTAAAGGVDLAQATTLQRQGNQANRAGDHARGLEVSRQALDACGGTRKLDPCGYAAYEVGYALNRLGQPDAAIPYLQQRLAYGDNSPDAQRELDRAYAAAGGGSGKGKGKAKGNDGKGNSEG